MNEFSHSELGVHDSEAGVFVMHCWVREDGELAGRVRWSTIDGDQGTTMLGGLTDLVNEAENFLHRVSHDPPGNGASTVR
jgi:hypothetical protein